MIFYHLARAGNIDAILNNGVLEPVSYPDLAACEVLKLRGQGVPLDPENFCTCPLPHDRTPVTWLYPVRWYTPMLGPKNAGYFFILNLPSAYE